jgi:ATP-dependent Lon protease
VIVRAKATSSPTTISFSAIVNRCGGHLDAEREQEVLMRSAVTLFDQYVKLNKKVPPEVLTSLSSIDEAGRLADTMAAHMSLKLDEKQHVLEMVDVQQRLEHLMGLMEAENDILQMEKRIRGRVKRQMEKNQREYYLNEQMKAIQKELGELEDAPNELEDLGAHRRSRHAEGGQGQGDRGAEQAQADVADVGRGDRGAQLHRHPGQSVPWKKRTRIRNDIRVAEKVLDTDHYGLEKVKERILEYLAVQQRVRKLKGPILCLVGPPASARPRSVSRSPARPTASSCACRSAACATRPRSAAIAAPTSARLPGKIIQNLSKAGSRNAFFLLDEIDKMAMDFRGDPASALLEVLDPEQNHTFNDHYLEVDFDLSEVMFVGTANTLNIPPALLDRMEVIRLSGYTEDEKVNIAQRYLIPKQMKNNGLKKGELTSARRRCATSSATTPARPACGTSSARSPRSAARSSRRCCSRSGKPSSVTPKVLEKYLGVALPLRPRRRARSGRPGHRPGLDRGRRRAAAHRVRAGARQGQVHLHGPAR